MFPPNTNTPAQGSTPTPAQQQQQTTEYLTKEEFSRSAAYIRGLSEKLDTLTKNVPTMDVFVQLGILEKAEDGSYKPKAQFAHKKDGNQEPEWQVQLRQMQEQMAAKDRQIEAEKKARQEGELKSAVIAAMDKAGAVNASRDYVHVLPQVKRADDGSFHAAKKNDFGVEENVPLETFFTDFLTANPELKKAAAKPGSGTPAGMDGHLNIASSNDYMANREKILKGDVAIKF